MSVVNLKGRKPQVIHDNEIYIGRAMFMGGWRLPKSKWANPFKLSDYDNNRDLVLSKYEEYVRGSHLIDELGELVGHDLACWCRPEPCHGDVLLGLLAERHN